MKFSLKVLTSLLVTGVVSSSAILLSGAFFSDTEKSVGNTFQAGKIDLLINGQNDPAAIVNITDLKPGDDPSVPKTIYIDDNPAYVWMHLKDLVNGQGEQTEPEEEEEAELGAPKSDLENYLEYDLSVGGNTIINSDSHTLLPDAVSCWIPLGELPGGTEVEINQNFHFPDTVTNWAQGDTLTFTEEFLAIQSRNNPNPQLPDTGTGRIWDPEQKKCVNAEAVLVDTVNVPSTSAGPTLSNIVLESGKNYRLDVSGTYIYWPSCPADGITPPCIADAEYALRPSTSYGPGWVLGEGSYPPAISYALDLTVDGNNIDWGIYSDPHTYSTTLPGTGAKAGFSIYDDYYSDNSGSLTVQIYQLP